MSAEPCLILACSNIYILPGLASSSTLLCRYWKTLNVILNDGSKSCTLGIVNSAKTKSLEHKVKVSCSCWPCCSVYNLISADQMSNIASKR